MRENIATVGLDMAKISFHVHAVDETGHCVAVEGFEAFAGDPVLPAVVALLCGDGNLFGIELVGTDAAGSGT